VIGAGCVAAASICALPRRASAGAGTTPLEAPPDLQPLIDRERKNIIETMAKEDIPGAAVCLIYEGKPAWIEGFGVTDRHSNRRIDLDTIFSIQSTSKNITATGIMLAVQRGLLDLDKPIITYLPDFTVHSRFEVAPQEKITLRHLLSHRAGFTHEAPIGNNYDPTFSDFEAHVHSISQTWLRYPVGERYRYSNLGFDLAGYILQTVSNKSFAECVKTMIFEPLGMSDTTAAIDVYTQRTDRAIGHEMGYETVPLKIPLIPSGGVYTSARDMAAYFLFHLNKGKAGGKSLLEERLWNEMHSFSLGGSYSLGIAGGELRFGDTDIRMLNHNGGGFGFGCVFRLYPQAKLAWAALFNRSVDAAYQLGGGLTDEILTRRYGKQKPRIPIKDLSPIDLPQGELRRFVGNWIGRGLTSDIKIENGTLGMQLGQYVVPVRFTSPIDIFIPGQRPSDDAIRLHYFPSHNGETAHFESLLGDTNLDYNDGPNDVPGPDKKEWDAYLGRYAIEMWGKPSQQVKIHRKNGDLYLDAIRLIVELEPGLFFTSDGEAVDFRHPEPIWRNIRLQRATQPAHSPRAVP
jgi:CubicO group peptidase (beta-lactamase class C family)